MNSLIEVPRAAIIERADPPKIPNVPGKDGAERQASLRQFSRSTPRTPGPSEHVIGSRQHDRTAIRLRCKMQGILRHVMSFKAIAYNTLQVSIRTCVIHRDWATRIVHQAWRTARDNMVRVGGGPSLPASLKVSGGLARR